MFKPRKPSDPGGNWSQFFQFLIAVWEMLWNGGFPFKDTPTVKWDRSSTGYAAHAAPPAAAGTTQPIMFPFKIYQIGGVIQIRSGLVGYRSKYFVNAAPAFGATFANYEQEVNCTCTDSTWLVDDPPTLNPGPKVTLANATDTVIVDPNTSVYYGNIAPASAPDENGEINLSFWLEIVDTNGALGTYSQLYGRMWTRHAGSSTGRPTTMFPASDKNIVPLGSLGVGANPFVEQIQWGNLTNRYPQFPTDDTGTITLSGTLISAGGSALNYRGDWDINNLAGQVFYPGDIVCDSSGYTKATGSEAGGAVVNSKVTRAFFIHRGLDLNPIDRPVGGSYPEAWVLISEILTPA